MAAKGQRAESGVRVAYLTLYNAIFASLWASVLFTVAATMSAGGGGGAPAVYEAAEARSRWVQTLTLIEVVHSALGLVRSPVGTTALQVVARTIIVWMVCYSFPATTASSAAYVSLLLSWAAADTVRYAYLALNLHGKAPAALVWLRYTMFYPLYPVGIASEFWLLYLAVEPARRVSAALPPVFYFCLCLYVPGSYVMYTYMIKQRRKTLSKLGKSQ
ncbi:protein tyrosine phosphatase-like protein [Colletotrichum graminicola]|uniref:Very-long-chain (3R)-3-hydroxyacyl-CoA dehydratase n=1 Tax=Colletotrichum graminicola (strain M1.001 / M2 / FGSC 10212) TaxID=645133 RepID=E3QNI7_COLGM|nr:protein tyrosine phosphatase-like protein [Colletotrichum graminicola M1.001]EFQ32474.1 protein tyrosine phosphatase-like protein [Colletotrichum graminicola M1.001]WDK14622.1 protein tyrosine phosphatase-like protein [Colletotrichum graminicola]